jgi:hypothetical protein
VEAVLGLGEMLQGEAVSPPDASAFAPQARPFAPAAEVFESGSLWLTGRVDVQALTAEWAARAATLVRAKGIVEDLQGGLVSVQWAGRQAHVEPWTAPIDPSKVGRVAWIGLRGCSA